MRADSHPASRPSSPARPDRADKRMVTGYLEPDAFRDLKVLIAKKDTTTDAAVTKAIEVFFRDCGEKVPRSIMRRLKTLGL